jgi:hypothetical protein
MSEFLETLKERLAEAQRRIVLAQARLQQAQVEFASIQQEHNSWAHAVNTEMRREQIQEQIIQSSQPMQTSEPEKAAVVAAPVRAENEIEQPVVSIAEINKTQLIRDVLQQHPNGIKPVGVWHQVRNQVARNYVYSVLSRMKEKKQVVERRGKYFLQIISKPEEAKDNAN